MISLANINLVTQHAISSSVDREELRKDKAVEVPADEVQELIFELLREHEAFSVS